GQPFTTTKQLAELVVRVVPTQERGKHPATRVFQAIRIAVNNELEELKQCLTQCLEVLTVGGRIAVISFHSLEDRIVKRFFQKEAKGNDYPPGLPVPEALIKRRLKIIGSLIRPTDKEVENNIRARSARLRIAEKLL
ncbi:MAG: 16S rRNA (cytosine(1402)-N(4))-methyltransferase RsmH, partial [Coxiellaceae bacterium]|nr:16S rRNA (cytosine(1402)-N(4))-methyltransferase RsmH [Coxiellaceae bacterium]